MESQLVYLKVNSTLKDIVHVMATSSFSVVCRVVRSLRALD
jgi:hypothetical protein